MTRSSPVVKKLDRDQTSTAGEPPPPAPPIPPPRNSWTCAQCKTSETPVKRSGPEGPGTLCNACGIRIRKRTQTAKEAAAAAAASAAGLPPQRRSRQKKRPPPKRKAQKRKRNHEPASPKKQRRQTDGLKTIPRKSVSQPVVSIPLAAPAPVVTVRSPHGSTANPVAPTVATGIVVPVNPAARPAIASALALAASTTPVQMPALTTSMAMEARISTTSTPIVSTTVPTQTSAPTARSAPVPTLVSAQRPIIAPPLCVPPVSSQTTQIAAPERRMNGVSACTTVKPEGFSRPTGGTHQSATPPQPPTTPEGTPLLPTEAPANAMVAQFPQSGQTGNRTERGMLASLDMGSANVDVGTAESTNETGQDEFPGSVFARCDSNGTASTQLEVLDLFGGMNEGSDSIALENSMSPLQVPQGDKEGVTDASLSHAESPLMTVAPQPAIVTQPPVPVPTGVGPPGALATKCVHALATLERMNAQIQESVCSIDKRIAVYAKRHEELTVQRHEVSVSISQLISAKDVARKKYRHVSESIARTTCLLHLLRKQVPYVVTT